MLANPFAVEAHFEESLTLTFAVPRDEMAARLPAFLAPDAFQDRWAFVAVAVVRTRRLRPKGFPAFLGSDFILAGYRYFVRYRDQRGRSLRGLKIIRSETDRLRMKILGNIFTRYLYVHTPIRVTEADGRVEVSSGIGGLRIVAKLHEGAPLPPDSPFADWREARRFSGPLPFTFSHDERRNRVVIVEGARSHWHPKPVEVLEWDIPFLATLGFSKVNLANAFTVRDIPYEWKRGRSEALDP